MKKYLWLSVFATVFLFGGYVIRGYGSYHDDRVLFVIGGCLFSAGALFFSLIILLLIKNK